MRCFLDTSALLARYFDSPNAFEVDRYIGKATEIAVSGITKAEFYGALGQMLKAGAITQADHAVRLVDGEQDFAEFDIVQFSPVVESMVKKLAAKYGHRTLDNIQLASALLAKPKYFVTADKRLAKLARSEKLNVKLV